MLKRAWRPVATSSAILGASAYAYHYYSTNKHRQETFDLQVRGIDQDGKRGVITQTFNMISAAEVEARLRRSEQSQTVYRPGGIVWRHTTAQLASNDPIEDAHAAAIVERDPSPDYSEGGDFMFFAVMDGHGGPHTSRLLSKILLPAVHLQLQQLAEEPSTFTPKDSRGFLSSLWSYFHSPAPKAPIPYDTNPKYVSLAIQTAFAMVDSELINAPLRVVAEHIKDLNRKEVYPDLSKHPMALATMLPALSGSCALLALIDTANRDLYIACTGDCRAVAGVLEVDEDGKNVWRVEVLSEDQTGRNPKELERIKSEHPTEESDTVVRRGRILGGLEPSRAFGDARYKWPVDVQGLLYRAFLQGNDHPMKAVPPNLRTPPYVTAQPVVTHRKLSVSEAGNTNPKSSLRFLVLATDGLWDQLSSEDVVALVAGHLAGLSGTVSKKQLNDLVPTKLSDDARTVEGKDKSKRSVSDDGQWAFVDENVSTHLIRNAFGGADETRLRRLLSIPPPLSRNYRDDVTVTVVWWEDGKTGSPKQETLYIPAKAKL